MFSEITVGELKKKLAKYEDHAPILLEGRVSDELLPLASVRKNSDGDIVLRAE